MKNRQKITRVVLDTDSDSDYLLLGLVSAEPDYKLSLSLNKKLKLALKHKNPIEVEDEKGILKQFSRFSYQPGNSGLSFNLISNKSGGAVFLKKLNKIDYLLQVNSPENDFDREKFAASLRSVESITAVFPVETAEIRDKNLQYLIT